VSAVVVVAGGEAEGVGADVLAFFAAPRSSTRSSPGRFSGVGVDMVGVSSLAVVEVW